MILVATRQAEERMSCFSNELPDPNIEAFWQPHYTFHNFQNFPEDIRWMIWDWVVFKKPQILDLRNSLESCPTVTLQFVNWESRDEVLRLRKAVELFIPLSNHFHNRLPHAARPAVNTFLTRFSPNGNLVNDDESGVWKPWVDCYINTKGLHHIQRLILVATDYFQAQAIYRDLINWADGLIHPPADSAATALLQMRSMKRVFLVPTQDMKHTLRRRGMRDARPDLQLQSLFWTVFNLLAELLPGYSKPELYYIPYGSKVRAEDLLSEVPEQFQLFVPDKHNLKKWSRFLYLRS
ncbi:hypothetical protein GLAREA_08188 [Glarea lozoyensis ATCC 20868]|uniref:2EXR domain-containing protein n=1 Tax=Glarea lozoyensis (strain ATCC 20868 / MF5171) TaxID=1116229 RepID=S3CX03_GLAL2|nr:uncharacterized protein GLAREA_08188 [Glarea lozoyensis ATCC 20868]EPE24336.1 hypothetical protein GLAREA_08188 [Glarea lozoyensis ATCC 20868]